MTPRQDLSACHRSLIGHEGERCVLRTPRHSWARVRPQRSFIVGRSAGPRPVHLACRRGALGSYDIIGPLETLDILRFERL
jgi:hypothetical protein